LFALLGAGLPDVCAELRVATYNLKNYLVMDRVVANQWRPDYPKPEHEKTVIRRNILKQAPDILVLQEMGPVEFLEELRVDLAQEGLAYDHAVFLEGPDTERHIALLSTVEPLEVVEHVDLDFKYFDRREGVKRGMLEVSFGMPSGGEFKLFAVHLKSRFTDDSRDPESALRRVREAEACRDRVIERTLDLGRDRFMIVGDFNDHPRSSTMRRFYRRGDLEIASLLPAADSLGHVWTYFYKKHGQYSRVDGFVVSSALFEYVESGRAHIVDSAGTLEGSDHRMLYLDLWSDRSEKAR
jgi:endonuclease/exonuclease/phosphatase family metal-dependent hydrolase